MTYPLNSKAAQFAADVERLRQIVNGGENTVVETEGGPVKSISYLQSLLISLVQETLDPTALAKLSANTPGNGAELVEYRGATVEQVLDGLGQLTPPPEPLANGYFDVTDLISEAANRVSEGAIIQLPPGGKWYLTNLTIEKGITLDFNGGEVLADPTPPGVTVGTPAILFKGSIGLSFDILQVISLNNIVTLYEPSDEENFKIGDFIIISDQKTIQKWNDSGIAYTGRYELNRITGKSEGNIYLEYPVEWTYDTNPSIQIVNMIRGACVKNIKKITEVDPGGIHTGLNIQQAPHLIQFQYCYSPIVEQVSAERFNLHAVNFHYCLRPYANNITAEYALRPAFGGHGYMLRFNNCRLGLVENSQGCRMRHVVDHVQSYDCISRRVVVSSPYSNGIYQHGFGEKRCHSIEDEGYNGEANDFSATWAVGNSAFSGAFDTKIYRPKFRGAAAAVIVGYRSEDTEIIDPDFIFSSVSEGESSRGVMIISGAKRTNIKGGLIDLSRCSGSAGDHPVLARYNLSASGVDTVSPEDISVIGVKLVCGQLSDRAIALNNTAGKMTVSKNEIFIPESNGNSIVIDFNSNSVSAIIAEDNIINGNAINGIKTIFAPNLYRVVNNRGNGVYSSGFTSLIRTLSLIDVMNSADTALTFGNIRISGLPGTVRSLSWQTNGVDRFIGRVSSDSETGSNAGSNFQLTRRSDSGGALSTCIEIDRATGRLTLEAGHFTRPLMLGAFSIWVDSSGRLRIKNGLPSFENDGTVIGSQS